MIPRRFITNPRVAEVADYYRDARGRRWEVAFSQVGPGMLSGASLLFPPWPRKGKPKWVRNIDLWRKYTPRPAR